MGELKHLLIMGKCLSCIRRSDDDAEEHNPPKTQPEENAGEDESTFSEEERKKPRDERKGSGEKIKFRRRSSGLSRFSTDDQHVVEKPFKIAAFNVQRFGTAKMKNKNVVKVLVQLIMEFDIILIQEITDTSGKAIEDLLEEVNEMDTSSSAKYQFAISPRIGRNHQKEQYVFFYRANTVKIIDTKLYPDPGDVFIREPYIVQFSSSSISSTLKEFTIVALHAQPSNAPKEIDALVDVHKWT